MIEYRSTSPQTSEVFSDEMDSASVKDRAPLNKSTVKHNNNNNFKSAYVIVQDIRKPVIHGRKTFAFWTLVCLLLMLAIGNLILTVTIVSVLKLGYGMASIELLPHEKIIKFFGDIDLDHIYKRNGKIEGFDGESLAITGYDNPILVNIVSSTGRSSNKLKIDKNETVFQGFNSFKIMDKYDHLIFALNEPEFYNLKEVNNLKTKQMETNRITSPSDKGLRVEGETVNLKGAEGTKINGKEIMWRADQDIYLKSVNGAVVLNSQEGILVNMEKIPIAKLDGNSYVTPQFKICVCKEGKLFRVPVVNINGKVYCNHINMSPQYNPCI